DRPLLGHLRVDHPPPERARMKLLMLTRERSLGLEHDPGRPAHRLDATNENDRRIAPLDHPAGLHRRVEARAAQSVDRRPRHAGRQPPPHPPPPPPLSGCPRRPGWAARKER